MSKHKAFAEVYIVLQTPHDVARHVKAIKTRQHKHSTKIWRVGWLLTFLNRAKVNVFWGGGRGQWV